MRNRGLDGIRGWAAVAVVFFHSIAGLNPNALTATPSTPYGVWNMTALWITSGNTAVRLFFIISGCVLFLSMDRLLDRFDPLRASALFAIKRVLRIYPALIFCIVGMTVTYAILAHYWPASFHRLKSTDVISNVLLIDWKVQGATWTLNVEMLAVVPLIILGLLFKRYRTPALIGFVVLSVAIHAFTNMHEKYFQAFLLVFFAAGALIPTSIGERAARIGNVYIWLVLLTICMAFIIPRRTMDADVLQALFGFLFAAHVYHGTPSALATFLKNPLSQFLGKISYSLYLSNVVFLEIAGRTLPHAFPSILSYPVEFGLLIGIAVLAIAVPLSAMTERWIEQPFIRIGNKIEGRVKRRDHYAYCPPVAAVPAELPGK